MNRRAFILASVSLWFIAPLAFAATQQITPELVSSSEQIEGALHDNAGHASTVLEGDGGKLHLAYSADEPIKVYMIPLAADGTYVPTDTMLFTLAAGNEREVTVDLTLSPGWSLGPRRYTVNMLTHDDKANVQVSDATFLPVGAAETASAFLRHLFVAEPFTPSSYHALRGYRIMGQAVTVTWGFLILVAGGVCLVAVRGEQRWRIALAVLVGGMLIYSLRLSVDLLSFTHEHLSSWYSIGVYDEAGSIYTVADYMNAMPDKNHARIFVCRDGTNFKEKLLRYFVYPIPVSADEGTLAKATHILEMNKYLWSFAPAQGESGTLHCGKDAIQAIRLQTFADGSVLFALPSSKS